MSETLKNLIQKLNKDLGDGTIAYGLQGRRTDVDTIPTGAISLDLALGVYGIPRGRVTEIFGDEASGKTTLALHVIANAQRAGGAAAIIDVEHALDVTYAGKIGVDMDKLLISQPDTGEQAMKLIEALVDSGEVDVVVLDSVAALATENELQGEIGDSKIAGTARLMSSSLRRITANIGKSSTAVIFINQKRAVIGGMSFGPRSITTGGKALKYYSTCRIEVRTIGKLRHDDEITGNAVEATVVKNKLASPFRKAKYDIIFGRGICHEGVLLDLGSSLKIVKKSGSFFSYGDHKMGNGKKNAIDFLLQHRDVAEKIKEEILARSEEGTS